MTLVEEIEARWPTTLPAAERDRRRAELRAYVQAQIDRMFKNGEPKCLR
jgi:hypothetical protein